MTREEKLKKLQQLKKMKELRTLKSTNESSTRNNSIEPSYLKDILKTEGAKLDAFKSGIESTRLGLNQGIQKQLGPSRMIGGFQMPKEQELKQRAMANELRYEEARKQAPFGSFASRLIGEIASVPVPGLGPAAQGAKLLPRALRAGTESAMQGGLAAGAQYAPEGVSQLENLATGAAFGAGGRALLGGAEKAFQKSKLSSLFRGNLSPQEIKSNVEAARGTETGLGKILNIPALNVLQEKVLMNMPSAGAASAAQRTQNAITQQADNLMESITGGKFRQGGNPGEELQLGMKDTLHSLENATKNNYKEVDEIAETIGAKIGSKNLQSSAKESLKRLTSSKRLARMLPQDFKKELQTYASEDIADSLKNTNLFRAQIGEQMRDASMSGDRIGKLKKGVYSSLLKGLDEDIKQGIDLTKNDILKSKYRGAQDFYKKEIAPLQDRLVTSFTRKNKDPDTLVSSFFKPLSQGKERGVLLNKLTNLIDNSADKENLMNNLRLGVFAKAIDQRGDVDVNKIQEVFSKMGNEQRNALFKEMPQSIGKLENLSRLNQMNKSAKAALSTREQTGKGTLQALGFALPGATAFAGYEYGGVPGAILGGVLGAGFGPGRMATRVLTNEKTREALAKKILEPKKPSVFQKELAKQLKTQLPKALAAMNAEREEAAQ